MELIARIFGTPVEGISAAETQARLNQKGKPYILDVRQPEEFSAGHIRGAKLIPLNELPGRVRELPKDREIICVCRSGNRSGTATRQLTAAGFQASNMTGGMIAWARAGLPVKQGKA